MRPSWEELDRRDLRHLAEASAREGRTTVEAMFSRDQHKGPALARAVFYAALYTREGWTLSTIGALVGRHHTSVWSAILRVTHVGEVGRLGADVAKRGGVQIENFAQILLGQLAGLESHEKGATGG